MARGVALRWLHVGLLALLLAGCAQPPGAADAADASTSADRPEIATAIRAKPGWRFEHQAIVAAHPLAADAGAQILLAGGSALDAVIAAQLVLGLVEPQSSGIGGGAFLMLVDGRTLQAWDGRETAPAAATPSLFLGANGKPLAFTDALVGGRAVGAPGVLRMLEAAHRTHGRLPWARLFTPAIALAENGFPIGARLHRQLETDRFLRDDPIGRDLFYDAAGHALAAGTMLRNPEYAAVLRDIAAHGADAFYRGATARAIVAAVQHHPHNPGLLAESDLAAYSAIRRDAMCIDWGTRRVCGVPPPSSGFIAIAQILGITADAGARLGTVPLDNGLPSPAFLHVYAEASRLAFADRNRYVADPAFVAPPGGSWASLIAPAYLAQRAALISPRAMEVAPPGVPPGAKVAYATDISPEVPSTSQLAAVDARGQAVAMTSSIEQQFGARLMVNRGQGLEGGFLLNNQLTDFAFVPEHDGLPVANRVQPGKRPRSSMSPTLVFDRESGAVVMATGSAGGAAIIHHTAKALLGARWGLTPQQAADLPNFGPVNPRGPLLLEAERFPASTVEALEARGHEIATNKLPSGIHTLMRAPDGAWLAGADPRREGVARGD
ncbi:MAG TPA: gamma-glutamyltransferase family protein [Burkholderiaceae bacterium]|nr:gamma-glutamyltransferase family protein [Burkholderiaceae bacterium]